MVKSRAVVFSSKLQGEYEWAQSVPTVWQTRAKSAKDTWSYLAAFAKNVRGERRKRNNHKPR